MKRLIVTTLALLGLTAFTLSADAAFLFGFGGFFNRRQNVQINNFNGGGFGNNRVFVNNGFNNGFRGGFGGNRVVVNNGFNGGFVNRGFGNRVVVNSGFGGYGFRNNVVVNNGFGYGGFNQGFVQRQVFVQSYAQPLFVQPSYVNTFAVDGCGCGAGVNSFGYGGFAVRARCY